ncbi:hypothetical protein PV04_03058 [Phialophora macrospora]|uniref:Uncharacterized protein n=1 Tax=Phialophora macrospora TaxID=1851006 RepID=A0A0D2GF49_9EURO|nr:hypothetical protein PV04_03058 [Phialophora macrospora]
MSELQEQEKPKQNSPITTLPFPPVTPQHILNTSFHSWYPRLRSLTPKARLIPLSQPFLDYLRADGIILPPEHKSATADAEDSGYDDEDPDDDAEIDPSESWAEVHAAIAATIKELGGKVVPKLNWSAPKDATWIATTNDMECRTPNDIYLLLKSSDFITHDLEHAFDGCVLPAAAGDGESGPLPSVPYHLVLRKAFNLNPSLEFRCFVRQRRVIAISQREMNHFDFLFELRERFGRLIREFVDDKLGAFPDENFVVDVYIPPPHDKVWLIDVNPWAPRTDPLLFSWLELLTLEVPDVARGGEPQTESRSSRAQLETPQESNGDNSHEDFVRLTIQSQTTCQAFSESERQREQEGDQDEESDAESDADADVETIFTPEFRLVNRDDPEAYQFSATKYSAHKLPRDVVDASLAPGGMKDMMEEWRRVMERQQRGTDTDTDTDDERT